MTIRAVIYARFSTDQQREESIRDQYRSCERVALSSGLVVTTVYSDEGISGGTAERPGYQAMLTAARSGAFEIIIAEDISRLWRSRAEFGPRSAEFEDLGIHLVTCVGDDTRRDGYGLVLGIKQAMAEHQRREISYRTRRGLEGLALAGKSTGGRCFGYRDGAVHEPEAQTVAAIFRMRERGYSYGRIVTVLNAKLNAIGVGQTPFPPKGASWSRSTVQGILANPRYTGAVIWGATEGKGGARDSRLKRRVERSDGPIVARHDPALAIVSQELFNQVQRA
jgi:site-specific DNA recombinase